MEIYQKVKKFSEQACKMPATFIDIKDLSSVFSGIGLMNGQSCQGVDELFRLWVHEMIRVFGDKFPSDNDRYVIDTTITWV